MVDPIFIICALFVAIRMFHEQKKFTREQKIKLDKSASGSYI